MKRGTKLVLIAVACALTAASTARAQAYVFAGGGATIPLGHFGDEFKTGWAVQGGVGYDLPHKGLWVEAEGWYGSNKQKDVAGAKTDIWAALGAVGYSFTPDKKVSPYVLAGAGILNAKFKPATGASVSESKFAYTGAAGIGYNATERVHIWVEGRFLGAGSGDEATRMIPITAGVTISFSKGGM